jgi:NRPS condensation-like uncharacterized protein
MSREGRLPLSSAQQRLWFLEQMEPDAGTYNIPLVISFQGRLNITALNQSLDEIVRRHEVLRTIIPTLDGRPIQVICPFIPSPVLMVDLTSLHDAERERSASRLVKESAKRGFDLARGPLLRSVLARTGEGSHLFALTMHHIVSDGWSVRVLLRELEALYLAFLTGESSPLRELSVQYADYAHWQQEYLGSEAMQEHIAYWKKELEGAPPPLRLSFDRGEETVETASGGMEIQEFPETRRSDLKEMSRREGVTLYMTCLAAFKVLLYGYTGQANLIVGSPIANRNRAETDALIGFFVNTLVLQTELEHASTFQEVLKRVRETALNGFVHQDLQFDKLVEMLRPDRSLGATPFFRMMFDYQEASLVLGEWPNLSLNLLQVSTETTKFDLTLNIIDTLQDLVACIEYDARLFSRRTINRMLGQYETILKSIATDPKQELSALLSAIGLDPDRAKNESPLHSQHEAPKATDKRDDVVARRAELSTRRAKLPASKRALLEKRLQGN